MLPQSQVQAMGEQRAQWLSLADMPHPRIRNQTISARKLHWLPLN